MESFLSRYRNLTALLLLIVGQLLLLAYQVKGQGDARLIRIWAVSAVTPAARAIEWIRDGTGGFFAGYVFLRNVQQENQQLRAYTSQLKLNNQFLSAELASADRAKVLLEFRSRIPSRTLPVRVIGTGTGANSRVFYVDRGSADGVKRGMAAITAEGIVGKVVASYPAASLVQLLTEHESVAGVISQKNRVRGILKGRGRNTCVVEYVRNEEKLEPGEWFYTSGADRIYPRGLPVGQVKQVREGRGGKEIEVEPSALRGGWIEEMLIVLDGVHDLIPDVQAQADPAISILPAPPEDGSAQPVPSATPEQGGPVQQTDADKVREKYRRLGESQGFAYGASPGRVADYNRPVPAAIPPPKTETVKPPEPPKQ